MQINRSELQKVRVKLSRDALTIQKEGGGSGSTGSSHAYQPGVSLYYFFLFFLSFNLSLAENIFTRRYNDFSWDQVKCSVI